MKKLSYIFLIVMSFLVINNVSAESNDTIIVCSYTNQIEIQGNAGMMDGGIASIDIFHTFSKNTQELYSLLVEYDDKSIQIVNFGNWNSIFGEYYYDEDSFSMTDLIIDGCPKFAYYDSVNSGRDDYQAVCLDDGKDTSTGVTGPQKCEDRNGVYFGEKLSTTNKNVTGGDYEWYLEAELDKIDEIFDDYKSHMIADAKFDKEAYENGNYQEKILADIYEKTIFNDSYHYPKFIVDYLQKKFSVSESTGNAVINAVLTQKFNDLLLEVEEDIDGDNRLTELEKEEAKEVIRNTIIDMQTTVENLFQDGFINETNPDCSSLLGESAKWFQLILDIMKYVAITALVILSIMDFLKSVAAQDNDALSKAFKTVTLRLVYTVIIFFIPIILNFAFTLMGIYPSDDCLDYTPPVTNGADLESQTTDDFTGGSGKF